MTTEKSIQTLELPRVLDMLAEHAVTSRAREALRALRPADGMAAARALQEQTTAARGLLGIYGSPAFVDVKPVEASLTRAELGGSLNTRELLDIAGLCRAARQVKGYGAKGGDGLLGPLFAMLTPLNALEDKITGSIADEDTIADAASAELASIRRHMRAAASRIRETLQKIISSPTYAKILQEPIITQRGDRFVVPVKAENKGALPGLTHDVSGSGATLFVEPMQVVSANNELKELTGKEQIEIERILAELSAGCVEQADALRADYQALIELDIVFARGKFSYALDGCEPRLNDRGVVYFKNARHPLLSLSGQPDKKAAVPVTVRLGSDFDTLVITGPNTGGKTVALKTIGLLSLMAACGLHLPADDGSEAAVFGQVMADIGDEQSIEQSLSTFSAHMTNIVSMLKKADENTLMLFDELGAGTDPVEGAALAVSIIERARLLGAKTAATTHYAEMKVFALTTPGVENAACEFDVETLRPTYRLLIGVPGKSNAFAISRRLGLDEDIIEGARHKIGQENAKLEDVVSKLEAQRQFWEKESLEASKRRLEAEQDAQKASETRGVLERERQRMAERVRAESASMIQEARDTVDRVLNELAELQKADREKLDHQALNQARASLRAALNQAERELAPPKAEMPQPPQRPLKAGDTVVLTRSGTKAVVISPPDKNGRLELQAGLLKVTAKLSEVRLTEEKPTRPAAGQAMSTPVTARASTEADLRGMTTDEAVMVMEQFIDNAILAKLNGVTLIHGKGTGALRAAVHMALKKHRHVKSFRLGRYGEGEDGVTLVELK